MDNREDFYTYGDLTYPNDMLRIVRNGLKKTPDPKRVIIIGGGMAGLVSASLLKDAGHSVTILEGNDRIGGRVYTLRKPFSEGLYLDVGAMRFPETHDLVAEYVKKFHLPTNEFRNKNDLYLVNGVQTTVEYYNENPNVFNIPLPEEEQGRTAVQLLRSAVQPFLDLYQDADPKEQERLRKKFNSYSFDDFLRFNPLGTSLSPNAIRLVKVVLGIEGFPNLSFVDILLDIVRTVFNEDLKFYEITGGNDQLPLAFVPELQSNLYYYQKVHQIVQQENGVTVTFRDRRTNQYHSLEADYVISTIPYSVLQFVDIYPIDSVSFRKWKAIRELTYVSSIKIGLEFNSRFWEEMKIGNIITDLPLRYTYSPSHNIGAQGPSVMLGSYSWGQNAMLWNSLPEEERIREALFGLSKIYGNRVYEEFNRGASYSWSQNQFSAGCFTLFSPNQSTDFSWELYLPEGRIHFAGEHTSAFHGWVEGAIESGVRAAYEVNERD
ncbi:flavin monoamine oxidase family protein [Halobacillus salinarum]|uniref:Flavin monoamine oxidase family protein n=1 Tax=Halobacillus salinarum TaxID=2932257 RepID=A0ABY4EJA0_9BACI|nr:flavin monoamine oxidase family protein [Halobacillus salinarum]UOQ43709.1 flavin monoamine oxidase family protein [Halobacillus salinarum]